jgi:hypothetical protein
MAAGVASRHPYPLGRPSDLVHSLRIRAFAVLTSNLFCMLGHTRADVPNALLSRSARHLQLLPFFHGCRGPCRTIVQPAAFNSSRSARSNCGAIQLVAGSASRKAVICRNNDCGSTSG